MGKHSSAVPTLLKIIFAPQPTIYDAGHKRCKAACRVARPTDKRALQGRDGAQLTTGMAWQGGLAGEPGSVLLTPTWEGGRGRTICMVCMSGRPRGRPPSAAHRLVCPTHWLGTASSTAQGSPDERPRSARALPGAAAEWGSLVTLGDPPPLLWHAQLPPAASLRPLSPGTKRHLLLVPKVGLVVALRSEMERRPSDDEAAGEVARQLPMLVGTERDKREPASSSTGSGTFRGGAAPALGPARRRRGADRCNRSQAEKSQVLTDSSSVAPTPPLHHGWCGKSWHITLCTTVNQGRTEPP